MSRIQSALRAFPPGSVITKPLMEAHKETQRQLDRAGLEAQLAQLEARLDPQSEFTDDHRRWKSQVLLRAQIAQLRAQLKAQQDRTH